MFRTIFRSAARQLNVVSKETIKPSSPTPSHLKRYNLSLSDRLSPNAYMPIVFYYPNHVSSSLQDIADKSHRLRRSLSEILINYYPFAGRLNSGAYVDCSDEGVEFQEVTINCRLSEILEKTEDEARSLVFPAGHVWGNLNKDSSPLVVRLNHFECGGISIAVCLSHRLADARTFSSFMIYWATKTRTSTSSEDALLSPHFITSPTSNDDDDDGVPEVGVMEKDWVTKRFVFPNSKIAQLKAMVAESGLHNPTRIEVVTALLYKCAMAATTANLGFFSPNILFHAVNLRPKMLPPLPETSVGNLYRSVIIRTRNESENNLTALVEKIKKGKMEIGGMKSLDLNECMSILLEMNNCSFFMSSSLCRLPFYQVDFGWGNPSRVTLADVACNNALMFMDTPNGDGIEALVSLEERNMVTFQHDKEVLAFTSSHAITEQPF